MYEFTFKVELTNNEEGNYYLDEEKDAKKVAKWFSDFNSWRVGEDDDLAFLSFDPVKVGPVYSMKCKFVMHTYSVHTNKNGQPLESEVKIMKEMLMDPDDDGNHPITLGGKEYLVMGF
jgi:hypothetical protein